jgi:hypothetical protein
VDNAVEPAPPGILGPRTRAQAGIHKPKRYTDGTIRYGYGCLATAKEPTNIDDAFGNSNWKRAMDEEILALEKNKTWHLVPPQSN